MKPVPMNRYKQTENAHQFHYRQHINERGRQIKNFLTGREEA